MAWKKAYEAYFADTFNRDSVTCYAADTDKKLCDLRPGTLSFTANNASINDDALTCATGWNGHAEGATTASIGFATDEINQVNSKIEDLQAQIDNLKKNLASNESCRKLRPALATLKYKREVE